MRPVGNAFFEPPPAMNTNVFQEITAVSTAIIMLALVVLIVLLIVAAVRTRNAGQRFERALQQVYNDLQPVIARSKAISDDVASMTTSIRENVTAVTETVEAANEKVRDALDATETRLAEFNALLDVVQNEAQDLFVSTAAAVRGVGRGAAAMTRRRGTDLASDEAEDALAADDQSDDHNDRGPDAEGPAPRIRPRARRPRAS